MPGLAAIVRAPRRATVPTLLIVCATVLTVAGSGWGTAASAADTPVLVMGDYPAADFADEARMLPAELTASVARDLALTPAEYVAQAAASVHAVDVVAALEDTGVDVLGSRMEGTELVVNVAPGPDRAIAAAAGATVESGAPDAVDLSSVTFVPAASDLDGGEGYAWTGSDGVSHQCSIGLAGHRSSDGRAVAVTAGHCVAGMSAIRGGIRQLAQKGPGSGGEFGRTIGTPGASAFGNGFDAGLITLDDAVVSPGASVLTWGGATKAPRSSAVLPVSGWSAAIAGASLCKSGSRTGWSCGVVSAVDRTVNVGGSLVNSILATTCIQPGDSGGPALIGQVAVGINSSTSSAPCGSRDYVSAFFPMQSAAGKASVQSRFGSAWEPAFTVAAPTIDAVSVPTAASAGSISGTAEAGQVSIHLDGSATPMLSAPLTGRSWKVDFAELARRGVAPGTHRLTVVANAGTWSRSPGAEATITFEGSPPRAVSGLLPADHVER